MTIPKLKMEGFCILLPFAFTWSSLFYNEKSKEPSGLTRASSHLPIKK